MKKLHNKILIIFILFAAILINAFSSFSSNDFITGNDGAIGAVATDSPEISSPSGIIASPETTSPSSIVSPSETTSSSAITSPSSITSPSGINHPAPAANLQAIFVNNNKCYYTIVEENGAQKHFEANYKNSEISAPHEVKKFNTERAIPGSNIILQNPLPVNGYFKGYIAFKKETEQSGSVAYFKGDLSQHMDLFEIGIPEGETIELLFASKDLRYFFYTQKGEDATRLLAYDLVSGQKRKISETGRNYIVESDGKGFAFYEAALQPGSNVPILEQLPAPEPLNGVDWFYSDESREVKASGYDTVILNGIVMDPETETIKFGYNVGITKDKISIITPKPISGREKIDATGLVVSPGFIDMLAFNMTATAAKYKVTDGVTTCLSMHGCTADFGSFFKSYGKNPPLVNYGGALFAIKLRRELGIGDYSKPTKSQINRMAERAREEIKKGAIAVAFSPEYYPGTTPEEIRAIMKVAREYNIPTHFHGRYSSVEGEHTGIDTVKEILGYAKELDAPVHFMHLHSCGGTGCMEEALQMINEARSEGYKVTYDIYPYDSWASRLNMARFRGDWQSRFDITYADLQIPTKERGLTVNSFAQYKSKGALCIAYAMDEQEVIAALKEDYCMIGSDDAVYTEGGANSHPRASGTFSRVIGRYSRDLDAFSLMDALQKLTINSAKHLEEVAPAMKSRGRLREGYVADITLFDYFKINDRSTAAAPAVTSSGIPYVIISGQTVLDKKGLHASARSGKPIKSVGKP
jgi:N-acyl-D-aspartate/D-glutamate deacylase